MFGNLHSIVLCTVTVKNHSFLVKKSSIAVVEPREIKNNAKNKKKKHSREKSE